MTESSHPKRCCDETGSLCASLFLHGVLFLVLSSSSSFDPPLGPQTRLDILWFTPATVPSPPQATAPQAAPAATPKSSPQPTAKAKRPQAPEEILAVTPGAAEPDRSHPAAAAAPYPVAEDGTLPQRRAPAEKAKASIPFPPPVPLGRAAAPVAQAALPAGPAPLQKKEAEPAHAQVAAETPPHTRERTPPAQVREQATARRPPEPLVKHSRQERTPQQPHPQERGTTFASLQGDLKLTVAGDGVKLTVAFRELPRSRRDRTLTKAEARRLQQVAPVTAKRDERTKEAVIEKAGEGVYIFSAEPETAKAAQASFTLTIFEAGKREKTVAIGTRTLQGKTVVARVLMPEGVLWDDNSAFTGSLEDSDSTTKFNAQTGLYWKEYAD